jgi:hypothetical protein
MDGSLVARFSCCLTKYGFDHCSWSKRCLFVLEVVTNVIELGKIGTREFKYRHVSAE